MYALFSLRFAETAGSWINQALRIGGASEPKVAGRKGKANAQKYW